MSIASRREPEHVRGAALARALVQVFQALFLHMEVRPVADVQAYCVKCKEKRTMKDSQEQQLDNGRRAAKGTCEVCGTKMTKFLPNKKD